MSIFTWAGTLFFEETLLFFLNLLQCFFLTGIPEIRMAAFACRIKRAGGITKALYVFCFDRPQGDAGGPHDSLGPPAKKSSVLVDEGLYLQRLQLDSGDFRLGPGPRGVTS